MKPITFKFRWDLLKAFWLKYELELDIEDVIIAFKRVRCALDVIRTLGVIADALKESSAFGVRFVEEESLRDELAGEIDGWFEFGGFIGGTIIEKIDKGLIKKGLDLAAQKAQIAEDEGPMP
jgi:hypothetical protein